MCLAIANKALGHLGMYSPDHPMHDLFDRELQREQNHDPDKLQSFVNLKKDMSMIPLRKLSKMKSVICTFVISLILATIRSQQTQF